MRDSMPKPTAIALIPTTTTTFVPSQRTSKLDTGATTRIVRAVGATRRPAWKAL